MVFILHYRQKDTTEKLYLKDTSSVLPFSSPKLMKAWLHVKKGLETSHEAHAESTLTANATLGIAHETSFRNEARGGNTSAY